MLRGGWCRPLTTAGHQFLGSSLEANQAPGATRHSIHGSDVCASRARATGAMRRRFRGATDGATARGAICGTYALIAGERARPTGAGRCAGTNARKPQAGRLGPANVTGKLTPGQNIGSRRSNAWLRARHSGVRIMIRRQTRRGLRRPLIGCREPPPTGWPPAPCAHTVTQRDIQLVAPTGSCHTRRWRRWCRC